MLFVDAPFIRCDIHASGEVTSTGELRVIPFGGDNASSLEVLSSRDRMITDFSWGSFTVVKNLCLEYLGILKVGYHTILRAVLLCSHCKH
jgi:hypothetical protein